MCSDAKVVCQIESTRSGHCTGLNHFKCRFLSYEPGENWVATIKYLYGSNFIAEMNILPKLCLFPRHAPGTKQPWYRI